MSLTAVRSVTRRSPADRAGVRVGDTLTHVNGTPIVDVLDYKFYTYEPRLVLTLRAPDGKQRTVRVRKAVGEELGLEFETYLMDRARSCANHCIFCFVDQLPPGMRSTLYFKDDDTRLSFLMGNYVTLTNLSPREVQRVIDLRISPINISVHTTDRELRAMMLGNRNAGRGIDMMQQFAAAGITMNCQIVSCPGVNDGEALERTMADLAEMYPAVNSVSVVPVGVTKYREGLYPIKPYTAQQAAAVVDQVERFATRHKARTGTSLVWCSDEFYLIAGRSIPDEEYYEEFTQLDNGVGMLRLLRCEFLRALPLLDEGEMANVTPFSVATGVSAAPFIQELVDIAREKCDRIEAIVYPVENRFFGSTVVVSGLITGRDLIDRLKGEQLGSRLLISASMLRSGEQIFLDDVTLDDVQQALGVPVIPVAQDGYELCDAFFGLHRGAPPISSHREPEDEYYRYNPGTRR